LVVVSIILAAHNEEEDIGDCLNSLLSQDYDDFEIIVVDDGSTDGTQELVETYLEKNRRMRMISNNSNKGHTYSRNLGAYEARGQIIGFTDADCILPKNWIQEIIDCFSGEEIVAASGPDITHPQDSVFARSVGLGIERGVKPVLRASSLAILRSSFIEMGGFDESIRYNDELDLQESEQTKPKTSLQFYYDGLS
jgi:glycosyltransferase involved in cell wall biosynthesis